MIKLTNGQVLDLVVEIAPRHEYADPDSGHPQFSALGFALELYGLERGEAACMENPYSSRVCERGTKCCDVVHAGGVHEEPETLPAKPMDFKKMYFDLLGSKVESGRRAGLAEAVRICDHISGNNKDFGVERRRGAGACAAAIRARMEGKDEVSQTSTPTVLA